MPSPLPPAPGSRGEQLPCSPALRVAVGWGCSCPGGNMGWADWACTGTRLGCILKAGALTLQEAEGREVGGLAQGHAAVRGRASFGGPGLCDSIHSSLETSTVLLLVL